MRWFTPAGLAQTVAARHDVWLDNETAQALADALINYADGTMEWRETVPSHQWPDVSDYIRDRAYFKLFTAMFKDGIVPVGLPVETVHYDEWMPQVVVTYIVPVRHVRKV